MNYQASYLANDGVGGVFTHVIADTAEAALELARINTPRNHHLYELTREDGYMSWWVYLERFSTPQLREKAAYWNMEWQRLGDRYYYEAAMARKADPKDKLDAEKARRISESILRHIEQRESLHA